MIFRILIIESIFLTPRTANIATVLLQFSLYRLLCVCSGAASSQEQLAVAAQNAVSTIVQLAEVVKFGAASLGSNNPEAQVRPTKRI